MIEKKLLRFGDPERGRALPARAGAAVQAGATQVRVVAIGPTRLTAERAAGESSQIPPTLQHDAAGLPIGNGEPPAGPATVQHDRPGVGTLGRQPLGPLTCCGHGFPPDSTGAGIEEGIVTD
jgi:hypothetical protein